MFADSEMRKFKLPIFIIVSTVVCLHITSSISNQIDVQPKSAVGICTYYYQSNRYTCDLSNAVISSPDEVLQITGTHLSNHQDSDVRVMFHVYPNSIPHFNGEVLRKFTNLEDLIIGNAGVLHISENAFDVCEKLNYLHIRFNDLRTLPPRMLQNCVNLKHFALFRTLVESIPEDAFGATANLEIFEVPFNRLSSLPQDLLRNMINLKEFSIASNSIINIDRNLLVNAVNLEKVDLSDNPLSDTTVITNLLDGHSNLNSIKLNIYVLTSFDFTFLSQFTQLTEFEIGGKPFKDIHWSGLPTSLTSIYISDVDEEIPGDALSHLINLKGLTLLGRGITNLHEDTFKKLVNLHTLRIIYTQIRTIPSNIFENQTNLVELDLGYNYIEELPQGLFASLVNLGLNRTGFSIWGDLHLGGNKIKRLNANTFGYHPHIQRLHIPSNNIAEIERDIFARFPNQMEFVDLLRNDCIDTSFVNESELQNDNRLEDCFNNWAGITTTTTTTMSPGAAFKMGTGFPLFFILTFILIFYFK